VALLGSFTAGDFPRRLTRSVVGAAKWYRRRCSSTGPRWLKPTSFLSAYPSLDPAA